MGAYNKLGDFYMDDNVFKKVEKKTKVDKDTIILLAQKIQDNGLKDEKTLRNVIRELSNMTGKNVPLDVEDKIISTILEDKVPKNIDKLF